MLAAGTQLGKYKVGKLLGSGGMADVYLATDLRMKRQVAIKVLPPEFGRNAEHAARFKREVMASAALEHPGIVNIFDVGQSEHNSLKYQYYVMQLLPSGDLKQKINKQLTLPEIFKICKELGSALAYAHKQGFIHRDIKPENILFDREDCAVLTDLGIARAMRSDNRMTDTGMSVGTPNYMSPEQAKGKYDLDGRADLYSLGVVLYEMLTGDVPYHADTTIGLALKHVNDPVPTLPKKYTSIQPVLDRLMAKDPEDRYPDARAFLHDLNVLQKHGRLQAARRKKGGAPKKRGAQHLPMQAPKRPMRLRFLLYFIIAVIPALWYFSPQIMALMGEFTNGESSFVSLDVDTPPKVEELEAIADAKTAAKRRATKKKQETFIGGLLKSAKSDLAALRLTKPTGNNAFEKYAQVLSIDENNREAKDGINNIVQSYIKLAESAFAKGDKKGALTYLNTAKKVDPRSQEVDELIKNYKKSTPLTRRSSSRQSRTAVVKGKTFSDRLAQGGRGPELTVVPSGSFMLGNTFVGGDSDEKPPVRVSIRRDFAVTTTEITFDDYDRYARANNKPFPDDENWGRGTRPVINVSWYDANAYADWLSRQTGYRYRLPTEAEWEYMAKYEVRTIYPWGNKPSHLQANYKIRTCCDSDKKDVKQWGRTAPVASYPPNVLGVYDLIGNVWEWVQDCKGRYSQVHADGGAVDSANCEERVVRGGSWGSRPSALRTTNRAGRSPLKPGKYNGFRLVRVLR